MFLIKSNNSSRSFVFSNLRGDEFTFEIDGDMYGAVEVSTYTDQFGLLRLIETCASYDRPWSGSKTWAAVDGNFDVAMSCSALGVVDIVVNIAAYGVAEEWSIQARLETDLGRLAIVANEARMFFKHENA